MSVYHLNTNETVYYILHSKRHCVFHLSVYLRFYQRDKALKSFTMQICILLADFKLKQHTNIHTHTRMKSNSICVNEFRPTFFDSYVNFIRELYECNGDEIPKISLICILKLRQNHYMKQCTFCIHETRNSRYREYISDRRRLDIALKIL